MHIINKTASLIIDIMKCSYSVHDPRKQKWSGKVDTLGFRILKDQTMNLDYVPDEEMITILKDSILFEDGEI